jgi:ABC-type multidrug transport system ATPase subunit
MGVCPQFDTLWMDLTCEETLLFYARLKGVAAKDENEHVLQSLTMVGLQDFPKRLVKDLSGGMRRRLSVAVSLVGNPRIVFLDEPTTYVSALASHGMRRCHLSPANGVRESTTVDWIRRADATCGTSWRRSRTTDA